MTLGLDLFGSFLVACLCAFLGLVLWLISTPSATRYFPRLSINPDRGPAVGFPNTKPKCWRILGVPREWTTKELLRSLRDVDISLENLDEEWLYVYPSCSDSSHTALLDLKHNFAYFQHLQSDNPHPVIVSSEGVKTYLSLDCTFHGLTPLNSPDGEVIADIVAVTGIAGHAFGSWRNRRSLQMWLRDFLPHNFPNTRVMTYGYKSNIIGNIASDTLGPLDYARDLIQALESARKSVTERKRPLLFVGHSMGGIVIMQTLLQSRNNPEYEHILKATLALFLFGTPHQGLEITELQQMLGDAPSARKELVEQLRQGSIFLQSQREDFWNLWNSLHNARIYSFYETLKTAALQQNVSGDWERTGPMIEMVKKDAAQFLGPREERIPVQANHTDMVKFVLPTDTTYIIFTTHLGRTLSMISEAHTQKKRAVDERLREKVNKCLKSLNVSMSACQSRRDELLSKRHPNTCLWFFSDTLYKHWARDIEKQLLSITGVPGSGKSVLSAALIEDIEKNYGRDKEISVAYFFCKGTDERLRTDSAILKHLLVQVLEQDPWLYRHFEAEPDYRKNQETTYWTPGMLWRVFRKILTDTGPGNMFFIVDAIDECEETSRDVFLQQIRTLLQGERKPTSNRSIKMVITTRSHISVTKEFESISFTEIPLDSSNVSNDINKYVAEEVNKLAKYRNFSPLREEIQDALVKGAKGMFLWATLIIDNLSKTKDSTPNSIRKLLEELPQNITALYTQILGAIDEKHYAKARKILQCVIYAARPLTVKELATAITIRHPHKSLNDVRNSTDLDLAGFLHDIFESLLIVGDDQVVNLVHQTAKDFLVGNDWEWPWSSTTNSLTPFHSFARGYGMRKNRGNAELASACLLYLCLVDRQDEQQLEAAPGKFTDFHQYSIQFWPQHVQQCEEDDPTSQLAFILRTFMGSLRQPGRAYMRWFEVITKYKHSFGYELREAGEILASPNPLLGAVYFGISIMCSSFAKQGSFDPNYTNKKSYTLLYLASRQGCVGVVELLIRQNANLDHIAHRNEKCPIFAAISHGRVKVLDLLLQEGAPFKNTYYNDILLAGVSVGNGAVMDLLIMARGFDLHVTESIMTAAARNWNGGKEVTEVLLHWGDKLEFDRPITERIVTAAAKNWKSGKDVIELLLARDPKLGPDVNIPENTVAAIARQFDSSIMKLLLVWDSNITITKAVAKAAVENWKSGREVMELLLTRRPSLSITDEAICTVTSKFDSDIIKLLLTREPNPSVTESVITGIAENFREGNGMMQELLIWDFKFPITENSLCTIARKYDGKTMKLLLARDPNLPITGRVITAVAWNQKSNREVMEMLLTQACNIHLTEINICAIALNFDIGIFKLLLARHSVFTVTEGVVTAVVENIASGDLMMKLLLAHAPSLPIADSAIPIIAKNFDSETMRLLLARCPNLSVTENIFTVATGNQEYGKEIIDLLLEDASHITVTEKIIAVTARNFDSSIMKRVLAWDPNLRVPVSESIATAAAENAESGGEILKLLLTRYPRLPVMESAVFIIATNFDSGIMELVLAREVRLPLAEDLITMAAKNIKNGKEVTKLLLARYSDIPITESLMIAAAGNRGSGEVIKLLLERNPSISITESAVLAAVKNREYGKEIIEILLDRYSSLPVTEKMVTAAAENWKSGREIMEQILADDDVTWSRIMTAAENWQSNREVMELILAQDLNLSLTESVVSAAAENWQSSREVIESLLFLVDNPDLIDFDLTEDMVITAAENWKSGREVMEVLLAQDPNPHITEDMLIAAVANWTSGREIMELLLVQDPNLPVTENVVLAGAENWPQGGEIMELLLVQDPNLHITANAVMAAAKNGESGAEVIKLFLNRNPGLSIPESVITAAADHWMSGEDVMDLLAQYPNDIITEQIINTIVRKFDVKTMKLLLDRNPDLPVTESLMVAAAGNLRSGDEILELLLTRNLRIPITDRVIINAVWNKECGINIMELLLARDTGITVTEAVVVAMARNCKRGKEIMELLLRDENFTVRPTSINTTMYFATHEWAQILLTRYTYTVLNEQYDQLVYAAVESGVSDNLETLLQLGRNSSEPDEHNWTAYMIAHQSQNIWALERLPVTEDQFFTYAYVSSKWTIEHISAPIQLLRDGLEILYYGKMASTQCSVKGNHPFPPGKLGTNYFEVTVMEASSELNMAVGFCGEYILQNSGPESYCFDSTYFSSGRYSSGARPPYDSIKSGTEYSSGNVIGCGINWEDGSYFYCLDGQKRKTMRNKELLRRRLYPLIAFYGDCRVRIQTNFQGPFEYDFSHE